MEREMSVVITANGESVEKTFYVVPTIEIEDQSFDHAFGCQRAYAPLLTEMEVYEGEQKIEDETVIEQVREAYESRYLEQDAEKQYGSL